MKEPSDKLWEKWIRACAFWTPAPAIRYIKWMRDEIKRLRARVKELEGR
jgi:hypothetical protein